MKKFGLALALFTSTFTINAQSDSTITTTETPETTMVVIQEQPAQPEDEYEISSLSNSVSNLEFGGYGAFNLKSSHFGKTNGWMLGGVAAVSFQHKFILGVGGYNLSSNLTFQGTDGDNNPDQPLNFGFSYGGLFLEYSPKTDKTLHLTYPVFFGWGKAKVFSYENGVKGDLVEASNLFLIEPNANIEVNVSSTFRLYGGAGLRMVFLKNEMSNLSNNDLQSFVLNIGVKIGRF